MDVGLDIETLGTSYEMGREGAGLSADPLTPGRDLRATLESVGQRAGIIVGMPGGVDDIAEGALLEDSRVMTSGFIDGWAESSTFHSTSGFPVRLRANRRTVHGRRANRSSRRRTRPTPLESHRDHRRRDGCVSLRFCRFQSFRFVGEALEAAGLGLVFGWLRDDLLHHLDVLTR